MRMIVWAVLFTLIASAVAAEDKTYLCIAENSVGFRFNDKSKSWEATKFNVDDRKYVIKPITPGYDPLKIGRKYTEKYVVERLGKELPEALCKNGVSNADWLRCGGEFRVRFVLNARTNRFLYTNDGGYMVATFGIFDKSGEVREGKDGLPIEENHEDRGGDTPVIEIGKCTEL